MKRINEQTFKTIKGSFLWRTTGQVAAKYDISYKTAAQIKVSRNFDEYTLLNKSQHLPVKDSLRDKVLEVHRYMFNQSDNRYIPPSSASIAIREIKQSVLQSIQRGQ